jgi:DNA-binding XRE family transcriptional regulator
VDPLISDLVAARKTKKLTQKQLIEMDGLALRTIILVESGVDNML